MYRKTNVFVIIVMIMIFIQRTLTESQMPAEVINNYTNITVTLQSKKKTLKNPPFLKESYFFRSNSLDSFFPRYN